MKNLSTKIMVLAVCTILTIAQASARTTRDYVEEDQLLAAYMQVPEMVDTNVISDESATESILSAYMGLTRDEVICLNEEEEYLAFVDEEEYNEISDEETIADCEVQGEVLSAEETEALDSLVASIYSGENAIDIDAYMLSMTEIEPVAFAFDFEEDEYFDFEE